MQHGRGKKVRDKGRARVHRFTKYNVQKYTEKNLKKKKKANKYVFTWDCMWSCLVNVWQIEGNISLHQASKILERQNENTGLLRDCFGECDERALVWNVHINPRTKGAERNGPKFLKTIVRSLWRLIQNAWPKSYSGKALLPTDSQKSNGMSKWGPAQAGSLSHPWLTTFIFLLSRKFSIFWFLVGFVC